MDDALQGTKQSVFEPLCCARNTTTKRTNQSQHSKHVKTEEHDNTDKQHEQEVKLHEENDKLHEVKDKLHGVEVRQKKNIE